MPQTVIGPGTRVAGPLSGQDDLVVEGTVDGPVTGEAQVTISAGARVGGEVRGRDVVIGGVLTHNVFATATVRLLATAELRADIQAARVAIDEGALLEGQVRMTRTPSSVNVNVNAHVNANANVSVRPTTPTLREIPSLPPVGKRKLVRRTP